MKIRAITGFFFVLAMLASVLINGEVFSVFYLLLATACLFEFYGMYAEREVRPDRFWGTVLGFAAFAVLIGMGLQIIPSQYASLILLLLPLLMILQLFKSDTQPFERIATTLLGIFYVIVPFYCFYALGFSAGDYHYILPLGFLLMLWANDTGAYLIGRAFGRNKLYEKISPGKTWEGFVGGFISAVLLGFILFRNTSEVLDLWQWLSMGALIAVTGTLGDLVESMLKRSLGVKDSGHLLPGHGGLLDRFDGLLISAPVVYIFLFLL